MGMYMPSTYSLDLVQVPGCVCILYISIDEFKMEGAGLCSELLFFFSIPSVQLQGTLNTHRLIPLPNTHCFLMFCPLCVMKDTQWSTAEEGRPSTFGAHTLSLSLSLCVCMCV